MARKLAVEIVGSAASLKGALGEASASVAAFAGDYKAAFAGMSMSTMRLAVAQDKLAISTAKMGVGTTGAAAATVKYRQEVESLANVQTAAMSRIGGAITKGITIPTMILGYEAVKMGVQFSQNMTMLQTQAGASALEVQKLSGEVLQLAKVSPQGPVELARGLYHLESLGLRGAKAMQTLRLSAMAAGMGIANIEDVATALGGAVVSNIKGTQDYQKTMGTLVATIGAGNMRMQDMTGALGTGLLPAAKNAGLSLDQVGAALAVLTDRGISAENAGTRLRMTFALMQAPSERAKKALADMGVDAADMSKQLHGPDGLLKVLVMLHEAMTRVGTTRGSSDILRAFGGGRSGAGILTLIQSLDSSVSSYQGKLAQINAEQGKFGRNMQVYMQTPAYKLSVALNTLKSDMTSLGQAMTPVVVGMAKVVSTVADAFGKLPGPIKSDLGIIIGILAVGGPIVLAIAGVRRMIASLATTFGMIPAEASIAAAETEGSLAGVSVAAQTASTEMSILQQRISAYGIGAPAAAAEVEGSLVGVDAAAATAAVSISGIRAGMLGLARMAPVVLTIAIVASLIPGNKGGQALLNQVGVGWLGKLPLGLGSAAQQGATLGNKYLRPLLGKQPIDTKPYGMSPADIDKMNASQEKLLKENFKTWSKLTNDKSRRDYKMARDYAIKWLTEHKLGFIPPTNLGLPKLPGVGQAKMTLPHSITEETSWAQTTASLKDDLKAAEDTVNFWQAQLKKAKKGTDAYDTILANLASASQNMRSLQTQISNANKKAMRSTFKMPESIAGPIARAIAGQDPEKELSALKKAVEYLKKRISGEKNAASKMAEESKLASYVQQIASVKKAIGKKFIASLQSAYQAAQITPGIQDDIETLTKLKNGLIAQIKLQKGNTELQSQLDQVNQDFARLRQNTVDQFRQTMGTLGQGPVIEPTSDPLRKWMLGVRHSAADYVADLKKQISEFKSLQGMIDTLKRRGAPAPLLAELRGQGMAAFPEVFALAHADKGTLKKFFTAFQEREQVLRVTANATITAQTATIIVKGAMRDSGDATAAANRGARGRVRAAGAVTVRDRGDAAGTRRGPTTRDARRATAGVGMASSDAAMSASGDTGPIHIHVEVDGKEVSEVVIPRIQRKSRSNAAQRRGRFGGSALGMR